MTPSERSISIKVDDRASMDHRLNEAHERMMEHALKHRFRGIVVTRHTHGHFTMRLSESVPFGQTEEQNCQNCRILPG
ncbi:hypothetical protein LVY72_19715 [Arthrobacter sp. I2-34]|uniref:Uncharacterized protein n=1 Tax=Arthrobacter hankyongi TaxID=2904801 RepID=A0ABS9LCC9_9MICC|nr:hypothetical protein [Arthrobacter hankyongi]MCG2624119.1 hypothetical protein [Arthrobacter hankyongi]